MTSCLFLNNELSIHVMKDVIVVTFGSLRSKIPSVDDLQPDEDLVVESKMQKDEAEPITNKNEQEADARHAFSDLFSATSDTTDGGFKDEASAETVRQFDKSKAFDLALNMPFESHFRNLSWEQLKNKNEQEEADAKGVDSVNPFGIAEGATSRAFSDLFWRDVVSPVPSRASSQVRWRGPWGLLI